MTLQESTSRVDFEKLSIDLANCGMILMNALTHQEDVRARDDALLMEPLVIDAAFGLNGSDKHIKRLLEQGYGKDQRP